MNCNVLKNGVYPAMITPFTADNKIDFEAVDRLVEWYIEAGCTGIFAACQSSEIYYLSLEERIALTKRVVDTVKGRIDVIACGATADNFEEMIKEAEAIGSTGVKAVVLLTNHLAAEDEDDSILMERLKKSTELLKDVDLGLYEIPVPYKRLLTPEIIKWCADSDRFVFMKDTSCNIEQVNAKVNAAEGSRLKIFNANTETLLETVKHGAAGISGIMCNYHPFLYVKMLSGYATKEMTEKELEQLQDVLTVLGYTCTGYTTSAKRYLMYDGVLACDYSRMSAPLNYNLSLQVKHLYRFTKKLEAFYKDLK